MWPVAACVTCLWSSELIPNSSAPAARLLHELGANYFINSIPNISQSKNVKTHSGWWIAPSHAAATVVSRRAPLGTVLSCCCWDKMCVECEETLAYISKSNGWLFIDAWPFFLHKFQSQSILWKYDMSQISSWRIASAVCRVECSECM